MVVVEWSEFAIYTVCLAGFLYQTLSQLDSQFCRFDT